MDIAKRTQEQKVTKPLAAVKRRVGLWVNTEFFRNLHKRAPQSGALGEMSDAQNRYLELVDPLIPPKPPLKKVA